MPDIANIDIENIREIVPDLLYNKLKRYHITSIERVLNISMEEFRTYPSVGVAAEEQLLTFKKIIEHKPEKIAYIYQKNCPKRLPFQVNPEVNLLELFTSVVEDFLNLMETFSYKTRGSRQRHRVYIDVVRKYYGFRSQEYDLRSIAKSHRLTSERVRQIAIDFPEKITQLIHGNYLEEWKCECNPNVVTLIQSFKKDLDGEPVIDGHRLPSRLKIYGIEFSHETKNYRSLLLNACGYHQISVASYHYLRNKVFYADESFDQKLFVEISNNIIKFLRAKVIPVSLNDMVIEVNRKYDAGVDFIKKACELMDEIEKTSGELYQIRFEDLATIPDYVYRILYEKRKALSCDEILVLINERLAHRNEQISKTALIHNIQHRKSCIELVGRTGVWVLKELNKNVDSQINLILKTFRTLNKPLTITEITNYIHEKLRRKDVPYSSVETSLWNYKKYFIKLKGRRYALAEKAGMYKDELETETRPYYGRKGILKTDIITHKAVEVLKKAPDHQMLLADLVRFLRKDNESFSQAAIYASIRTHPLLFKKEKTSAQHKIVKLVDPQPPGDL